MHFATSYLVNSLPLSCVCVSMSVLVYHGPAFQIYFFCDRVFSYNVSLTNYDVADG